MTAKELTEKIAAYRPWNEEEAADRALILSLLEEREDVFLRTSLACHITASAWVVSPARDRVLMAYHNIYRSWSWLGGHADGETDLAAVALREVREESGVTHLRLLSDDIYSLEVLTVDGHRKRGAYVPSHLHLNVTYLIEADDRDPLAAKEDENRAVAWFTPEEMVHKVSEPWMTEHIYRKLTEKLPVFLKKEGI